MAPSRRQERYQLAFRLREDGRTWVEISDALQERWPELTPRAALRLAHTKDGRCWTQQDAVDAWGEMFPDGRTPEAKEISRWETWPHRGGKRPSFESLDKLAQLYQCSVADLLADFADYRHLDDRGSAGRRLAAVAVPRESSSLGDASERDSSPQALEGILATTTVADETIGELDDSVQRRSWECVTEPPETMLRLLSLDVAEVGRFLGHRQPIAVQRKLASLVARLGALLGVEMLVVRQISDARAWHRLAMTAASEAEDRLLTARVGALRATLPLYYGDAAEGVRLARRAREDVADEPNAAAALAPCLEAVGLAQLGEIVESRRALSAAREAFGDLPEGERAATVFGFAERRLAFYESRALSAAAQRQPDSALLDDAFQAQDRALELYDGESISVGDPTLVLLDRAGCLARAGSASEARDLAEETLDGLPPEHRSPLFVDHLESVRSSSR